MPRFGTVICGAGIAGVATAFYLGRMRAPGNILLVDKLPPLSLTTSMSGENYRDYWPQACMKDFSTRSLDLMDALIGEFANVFNLRQSGYQFVSARAGRDIFGPGTAHDQGVHRETDRQRLRQRWPYLAESTAQVVTIERAGALDVHALGSLLLSEARARGVSLRQGEIKRLGRRQGGGFDVQLEGEVITADRLVLASGPFTADMAGQLDIDLPLRSFAQRKFVIPDPLGVIPADMPFTICADPLSLAWSDTERDMIAADSQYAWLLEQFPPGLHVKPEGAGRIKLGWAFNRDSEPPRWHIPVDNDFPNLVMRGASQMIPGLGAYVDQLPTPVVQYAGYYTRTEENWPLIGPLDEGLFVVAGLSGYGTMAACAAGELCALHMLGESLPAYGRNFHPGRYEDTEVKAQIAELDNDGQL